MICRARLVLAETSSPRFLGIASSGSLDELLGEFPSVEVSLTRDSRAPGDVVVDATKWHSPTCDLYTFDETVAARLEHGARTLDVRSRSDEVARDALEILTRYQRFVARRNGSSNTSVFDAVLDRHRALHDLAKPLVRADYDHALDVWQWALRLDPEASLSTQLAALLHDIERLTSEADARVEHRATDYGAFKEAHARGGVEAARSVLHAAAIDGDKRDEILWLIAHHERPVSEPSARARALSTLNDADGLSFFSLNSPGFVDYFGLDHARRKVKYTLARMSAHARARLGRIRLRGDVARILAEALA